jgi:hypothetical protein
MFLTVIVLSSSFFINQSNALTLQDCYGNFIELLMFMNVFMAKPTDLTSNDTRTHIIAVCEFYKSQVGHYVLMNQTENLTISKLASDKFNAEHPVPESLKPMMEFAKTEK